MFRKKVRFYS